MKKHFQHLQALLGARRGLAPRGALSRGFGVCAIVAIAAAALVSAQSPNEPALPEAVPPSPADAGAPVPGATLLEAQPVAAIPDPTPTPSASPSVAYQQTSASVANEPVVTTGRPVARLNYGEEGNRKAGQLRSMPPERFTFDRALLRDVLRFLAEAAGIPYVSIPENSPQAQQLVTFRMTASPFAALESVCRQYGIGVGYNEGVWFLTAPNSRDLASLIRAEEVSRKEDENELVGVMYQLRHDSADRVEFRSELAGNGQQNSAQQPIAEGVTTPNLPLQNSQKVFAHKIPRLVNDIRVIIGLPPLQVDKDGVMFDSASTGGKILDADKLKSIQPEGGLPAME